MGGIVTDFEPAFAALQRHADATPNRCFLTQPLDGDLKEWTFADALSDARRLARGLIESGLEPGDPVALLSKNCAEWVIADFAISMAGLISVPVSSFVASS